MFALAAVGAKPSETFLEAVAGHVRERMWTFSGSALAAALYGLVQCGYQVWGETLLPGALIEFGCVAEPCASLHPGAARSCPREIASCCRLSKHCPILA